MKKVRDHYFLKARKEGYVARSAFKLEEMDRKFRLLNRGQRVLDLGCAPGSWLQYAATRVLPEGTLVGLDLKPVEVKLPNKVRIIRKDIFQVRDEDFLQNPVFDILLSDMAPGTTGIRSVDVQRSYELNSCALKLSNRILKSGGTLVVKAFQGEPLNRLKEEFRSCFESLKLFKPRSSRNESIEIYLLGFNHKPLELRNQASGK